MDSYPSESTSIGGLRIKEDIIIIEKELIKDDIIIIEEDSFKDDIIIIEEEPIVETKLQQKTSPKKRRKKMGGAYEGNKRIKTEPETVKHDKFCWRCCGEGTSLKCSSCVRSFHSNCASKDETNNVEAEKWLCYVCTKLKGAENADKKSDLEMLPILIDKALKDKSFSTLKRPLKGATEESIVNPIDLTKIKENIGTYNSFEHFLADIQWIVHNCFILFLDNHEQMEIAKSL
ncbi:zinc finger MYND domain-containing protein 11-like, partial [Sitodiplosis mosellana]|uniref:zinc finger MYND domain-containing protein 11-like n=1 Tax=Sitodiplosis mosellana TaxID=263140 RepID=UPI002443B21C